MVPLISVVHVPAEASADPESKRAAAVAAQCSERVAAGAALVLLDTKVRGGPAGGSGVKFDWGLARAAQATLGARLGVAGGLDEASVSKCVAEINPAMVDVASGVEASDLEPGTGKPKKDHRMVAAFVSAAKASSS